jgi:prolycopene isomerase
LNIKERYDVIIIGAGISGLTSAAILSKSGLSVCVLEKQYVLGGYLQGFQRKGFIFDTAIHWLNQCGEKGTVTRIFNFIGNDFPRPQIMETIHRHVGRRHDYSLTNNPDELQTQLIQNFPEDKQGIIRFFNEAKKIAKISLKFPTLFRSTESMSFAEKVKFRIRQMSVGMPMIKHIFYSGEEGMKKGLSKYFSNPELRKIWCSERDMLSCLFPIAWAYNSDYQNPPVGGSQAFPKWLNENIEKYDQSDVVLSATVTGVEIEDNEFKSVTFTNRAKEYKVAGKYLIAACDVERFYEHLMPQNTISKVMKDKLKKAELYSSSVTISVALDCKAEELGFGKELLLLCEEDEKRDVHTSGDPYKSSISILAPTTRDNTMSPEGQGTLTLYVPAWMDYENFWKTGGIQPNGEFKRTPAYKAFKEEYAKIIFDRVEERVCPNLREHILFYEVATPITYYRYTHNRDGSMMGGRPGKQNMQAKVAHYKTSVPNVILGSHWSELGGGVPIATKAAFNASLIILKNEKNKYFDELKTVMK